MAACVATPTFQSQHADATWLDFAGLAEMELELSALKLQVRVYTVVLPKRQRNLSQLLLRAADADSRRRPQLLIAKLGHFSVRSSRWPDRSALSSWKTKLGCDRLFYRSLA